MLDALTMGLTIGAYDQFSENAGGTAEMAELGGMCEIEQIACMPEVTLL